MMNELSEACQRETAALIHKEQKNDNEMTCSVKLWSYDHFAIIHYDLRDYIVQI